MTIPGFPTHREMRVRGNGHDGGRIAITVGVAGAEYLLDGSNEAGTAGKAGKPRARKPRNGRR